MNGHVLIEVRMHVGLGLYPQEGWKICIPSLLERSFVDVSDIFILVLLQEIFEGQDSGPQAVKASTRLTVIDTVLILVALTCDEPLPDSQEWSEFSSCCWQYMYLCRFPLRSL